MWVLSLHNIIHLYCSSTVQLWIKYFLNKLAERDLCLFWRKALDLHWFCYIFRKRICKGRKGQRSSFLQNSNNNWWYVYKHEECFWFLLNMILFAKIFYIIIGSGHTRQNTPNCYFNIVWRCHDLFVNKPLFRCWLWGRRDIYADKFRAHWLI